jgi:hypothetical protein
MFEIFISYAREDAARIEPLATCLERRGWSVFWDRKIHAGAQWHDTITGALDGAQRVIVAWSQHSLRSDFVRDEAASAQARKVLIPILLDAVMPPLGFRQIQAADFSGWNGEEEAPALQQLLRDLGAPAQKLDSSLPAATVSAAPARERARAGAALRRSPVFGTAIAAAGVVAIALIVAFLRKPADNDPPARPAAKAAPTAAKLVEPSAKPDVPAQSEPKEESRESIEQRQALRTFKAYYQDLNAGTFDAEKYFAPRVGVYIGMVKTSPAAINRYFKSDFPRLYEEYRIEMLEATLVRESARVYTFREVSHFVDVLKKRRRRDMTAANRVTLDEHGKIVRFEQTYVSG